MGRRQEESYPCSISPANGEIGQMMSDRFIKAFPEYVRIHKYNLVGSAISAGAGHLTQIERQLATLRLLGLDDHISLITFNPSGKLRDLGDAFIKYYPLLQKNPHLINTLNKLFQSTWAEPYIDETVLAMMKHSTAFEDQVQMSPHFHPENPTIFMSTHVLTAMASVGMMQKRKNTDDILIEYIPDPWVGANLRAATVASQITGGMRHIAIVHDEETAKELHRIHPNSNTVVLSLGTLSANRYQHIETRETPINLDGPVDVLIQCSGNPIPNFDRQVVNFIETNAAHIENGNMRVVIDPMHHTGKRGKSSSYEVYLDALQRMGLLTIETEFDGTGSKTLRINSNENILLLKPGYSLGDAIIRRERVINDEDKEVRDHFGEKAFTRTIVVAKGGEKPLEDWGNSCIVFCPMISSPHEEKDILTGVAEGRAVDGRNMSPSNWFNEFIHIREQLAAHQFPESPQSTAHLAPIIALRDELVKYADAQGDHHDVLNLIVSIVWWFATKFPKEFIVKPKRR
ncbi:hypothetical protein COY90_00965 [Candidatus Roizmanbacteria bacterium CG_4_10_14_0_8_um_filter_39_9]|uniref:Uncharacterized protein n=1 Tax=Candidatus Roizmanbacteria bacterium CG_4_10_14_0_8_um_filter_39_9 TaxID=1974829 RepID=A0A2M7QEU0_9BACT|nr:MAG: hypothetical protein COY90_00965 [Candidatus Roizmanbacteria bacterium CG_4_10_14_0_8_um_filter_39_9]